MFGISDVSELPEKIAYFAYGHETCPTTGRDHLQCFAYAKSVMRFTQWKKIFPGHHIEPMKGNFAQNEKYCSKQGNLIELGERPMGNGKRKDLAIVCERVIKGESLKSISKDYPTTYVMYNNGLARLSAMHSEPYRHDTVRGYWLWGVAGAGKSHYAKERFPNFYIKAQNKWFDGYNGEESIILDDYDCGKFLGHYIKIWTDKWECTGEIKGGTVHLRHHHFVITSNYSIEQMFPDDIPLQEAIRRRCEVIHFGQVYKGK